MSNFVSSLKEHQDVTTLFHHGKVKVMANVHEYAMTVSTRFSVLITLENPMEMWNTFKRETLLVSKDIRERTRLRSSLNSEETLKYIKSRAARLVGNRDHYGVQSRRSRELQRRQGEVCQNSR